MTALVIPGVRVEARFDIPPPPPSPTGILGLVGLVDRPSAGLVGITSFAEIDEQFGPATLFSMPELGVALRNGVSEVVVSAVSAGAAGTATRTFVDRDGEDVLTLRARAPGPWGNALRVALDEVLGADGRTVRYVNVRVWLADELVEQFPSLTVDAHDPGRDIYAVLNARSRVLVAFDPVFGIDNPAPIAEAAFSDAPARAASRTLTAAGSSVLTVTAKAAGARGNRISVEVQAGRRARILPDGDGNGSLRLVARQAGVDDISVEVAPGGAPDTVNVRVRRGGGEPALYADLASVAEVVTALRADPDVHAASIAGGGLPAPTAGFQNLQETRSLHVRPQGESGRSAEDRLSLTELADAFASDLFVEVGIVEAATALPDAATASSDVNVGFLVGGRSAGPALGLRGQETSTEDVLEVVPVEGASSAGWALSIVRTGERVRLRLTEPATGRTLEEHAGLTMDPDDARFLPAVLAAESERLRAFDLALRSRTTALPRATPGPLNLAGGSAPTTGDYLAAIAALEQDERIDLVLASVQAHDDENLDVRAVHQGLLAFAVNAADRGAPALALGSVSPADHKDVGKIIEHAGDVRHQRFVLCTPSGTDAAVAGLLGRMNVHFSPTFKAPGSLPVAAGTYSESELRRLVDPVAGNVLVVQKHRYRGTIIVKGIATNGWQLNVTRTADLAVREVKKIAEGYIGELNDAAARNALQQQVVAFFTRLERDGAIVPSTDGQDPAFLVQVYATQQDFAQGIARIDIALRPVRAIDYVYATIRVRN